MNVNGFVGRVTVGVTVAIVTALVLRQMGVFGK